MTYEETGLGIFYFWPHCTHTPPYIRIQSIFYFLLCGANLLLILLLLPNLPATHLYVKHNCQFRGKIFLNWGAATQYIHTCRLRRKRIYQSANHDLCVYFRPFCMKPNCDFLMSLELYWDSADCLNDWTFNGVLKWRNEVFLIIPWELTQHAPLITTILLLYLVSENFDCLFYKRHLNDCP